jgi:hypothetical protein
MLRVDKIYFNAHLTDSFFFKPEQLYDGNKKILKDLSFIEKGNIYFIVERGKVRVDPKKVKLSSKGRIRFDLKLCDGAILRETIDVAPLFIDCGHTFKKKFGNAKVLQDHIRSVNGQDEYNKLLANSVGLPLIGISLIQEKQTTKNIAFRVYTPDGQSLDAPMMVHNIISIFNIDIMDYPKIVYIGKSSCLSDRIYKHEKIQQALSVLDDESDIYLYAFQFDTDKIIQRKLQNSQVYLERNYTHDVDADSALAIVEMSIINYFKPKLNINFVDSFIPNNEIFKKSLKNKYTHMNMEIIHDGGSYWNFGSEVVTPSLNHTFFYEV